MQTKAVREIDVIRQGILNHILLKKKRPYVSWLVERKLSYPKLHFVNPIVEIIFVQKMNLKNISKVTLKYISNKV